MSELMIDIRKLSIFNKMAKEGGNTVADHMSQMTGMNTQMEITKINFIDIPDIMTHVGDDEQIGIYIEMLEPPHGHVLFLFNADSAKRLAAGMLGEMGGTDPEANGFTEMEKSAIQEIGNIMTSGFIDGWANVLQTSIDHTPPRVVHDMGRAIIDPLAAQVGQHQEHAFIIESRMQTEDLEFGCEIHALPDDAELRQALAELDVERSEETEPDVERIFE
jgi:chemotaxis protein CheY-P-specific phosphatase CheC